jgi:hypothetical protein
MPSEDAKERRQFGGITNKVAWIGLQSIRSQFEIRVDSTADEIDSIKRRFKKLIRSIVG